MSDTDERDDYVVPGLPETVLRNRRGYTDPEKLSAFEREATSASETKLAVDPVPTTFDRAHLSGIHERLFEDTYEWAGRMRDETFELEDGTRIGPKETLGKGDAEFARASEITNRLNQITDYIESQNTFRDASPPQFTRGAAEVLAEVNEIHPFREGNGRTQREFITDLAYEAGYEMDWSQIDGPRNLAASKAASAGDLEPMKAMLRDASQPERRIMLAEADAALAKNPQHAWTQGDDITMRTLPAGETTRGYLVEKTEMTAIIVTDENAIVVARRSDVPQHALKMTEVEATGTASDQDRVWEGRMKEEELGKAEVIDFASRRAPAEEPREAATPETRVAEFAERARRYSETPTDEATQNAVRAEARQIIDEAVNDRDMAQAVNALTPEEAPEARQALVEAMRERRQELQEVRGGTERQADKDHEHEPD